MSVLTGLINERSEWASKKKTQFRQYFDGNVHTFFIVAMVLIAFFWRSEIVTVVSRLHFP